MQGSQIQRKPRILCLHGFRTSVEVLKKMIMKWPDTILEKLDLEFPDAKFPAEENPDVEALFDPNFEDCISYIDNYMIRHGPFHGLLGFSHKFHLFSCFLSFLDCNLQFF